MMISRPILFFAILCAVITVAPGCKVKVGKPETIESVPYTKAEQAAAVKSVQSFLSDMDSDRDGSWDDLSQILKASVAKFTWKATLTGFKVGFGKNLSRGKVQFACTDKIPDAPAGRYFIFDMESKFERANVTERVVLAREGDGWKVAGYFRKKSIAFGNEKKTP